MRDLNNMIGKYRLRLTPIFEHISANHRIHSFNVLCSQACGKQVRAPSYSLIDSQAG